jgi:hypothetical protein
MYAGKDALKGSKTLANSDTNLDKFKIELLLLGLVLLG